ncbi:MAG TPA: choice-of-anchor tandem repeat GloVer-containing protein [Chthonomonadaceae bacterium]|nr:choice-of-anchor tandem repeat GloVer-containing protein [Chthonomonadaceae bacterium]
MYEAYRQGLTSVTAARPHLRFARDNASDAGQCLGRLWRIGLALVAVATAFTTWPMQARAQDSITSVYDFAAPQGARPHYALTLASDGNFYGTAPWGGPYGLGTIYRFNPAKGSLQRVHTFHDLDGAHPLGTLCQAADGYLYGAAEGGANDAGVLFRLSLTGIFKVMHTFSTADPITGANADGDQPWPPVQGPDGALYGTTTFGGANGQGTLYRYMPATGLTTLYAFGATATDGAQPEGGLAVGTDGNLYGTTFNGGVQQSGVVFQATTSGAVTILCSLDNWTWSGLVWAPDGNLYGTFEDGGANSGGEIYGVSPTGAFRDVYDFGYTSLAFPSGPLAVGPDGALYGTAIGYPSGAFRVDLAGNFSVLDTFSFPEGAYPYAGLAVGSDGNFYSAMTYGATGLGSIYRLTPAGAFTTVHKFKAAKGLGPDSPLLQTPDGNMYGTTLGGGDGHGGVYRLAPDGSVKNLHSFNGRDGDRPYWGLCLGSDGALYGSTQTGGRYGHGTLFRITTDGLFKSLYSFSGADGDDPQGLAAASDGALYGSTCSGGAGGNGTLFRVTTGGALTVLHTFSGSDGANPYGPLIQATDGYLYGSAVTGGSNNDGVVYRLSLAGEFSVLHSFSFADGYSPGPLVQASDGNFYGAAGTNPSAVFRITPSGTVTLLHWLDYNGGEGAVPNGPLVQASDGNLYGTTQFGGYGDWGTVFQIALDGTFTTVSSFETVEGGYPYAGLMQASDGYLYGTTLEGNYGQGNVFRLPLP